MVSGIQVSHEHTGAFTSEAKGGCPADARTRAGDNDASIGKSIAVHLMLRSMVWAHHTLPNLRISCGRRRPTSTAEAKSTIFGKPFSIQASSAPISSSQRARAGLQARSSFTRVTEL